MQGNVYFSDQDNHTVRRLVAQAISDPYRRECREPGGRMDRAGRSRVSILVRGWARSRVFREPR